MRGVVEGMVSRVPIVASLPALFQEDDFICRFLAAFDEGLAPLLCDLDNFEAYLDPYLAPDDFLAWLAGWVGVALDETWPIDRSRALVAEAVQLYRWQGTARGLAHLMRVATGLDVEVTDSGGVSWSPTPGGELPGSDVAQVTFRVRARPGVAIDERRLDSLVAAAKPAHVPHRIEVINP